MNPFQKWRLQQNLKAYQLADLLGYSAPALCKYQQGKHPVALEIALMLWQCEGVDPFLFRPDLKMSQRDIKRYHKRKSEYQFSNTRVASRRRRRG